MPKVWVIVVSYIGYTKILLLTRGGSIVALV
jgi:hypothetical protein